MARQNFVISDGHVIIILISEELLFVVPKDTLVPKYFNNKNRISKRIFGHWELFYLKFFLNSFPIKSIVKIITKFIDKKLFSLDFWGLFLKRISKIFLNMIKIIDQILIKFWVHLYSVKVSMIMYLSDSQLNNNFVSQSTNTIKTRNHPIN